MRVEEMGVREPSWLSGPAMVRARDDERRTLRKWTKHDREEDGD